MKKIEIYKEDKLLFVVVVADYDINTYTNSVEVVCKNEELEITYSIPLNKGYRIAVEI